MFALEVSDQIAKFGGCGLGEVRKQFGEYESN